MPRAIQMLLLIGLAVIPAGVAGEVVPRRRASGAETCQASPKAGVGVALVQQSQRATVAHVEDLWEEGSHGRSSEAVQRKAAVLVDDVASQTAAAAATREGKTADAAVSEVSLQKCAAEFVAMALFVFIGCGSAMSVAKEPGWVLQVALTFGFAITCLAYALGHYSGGQINCAVTFGLVLTGEVSVMQGLCNVAAQLAGSVLGAAVLKFAYPSSKDCTGGLGTNSVAEGWSTTGALVAEMVGTLLLMYVVFETAINKATKANATMAPVAIGLAVFLAHSVLIPIDGCSINPTRSFGPALVQAVTGGGASSFKDMWVFWLGPLTGAAAAAGIYTAIH